MGPASTIQGRRHTTPFDAASGYVLTSALSVIFVRVRHALYLGIPTTSGAPVSTEDFDTASELLQIAIGLQRSGQSIKYVRTPEGQDISMGQLKTLVEEASKA